MTQSRHTTTALVLKSRQEIAPLTLPSTEPRAHVPKRPRMTGLVLAGVMVTGLFFGGLTYWSAHAPLASAAVAVGQVALETNRKTVQHLEGGIVREILVREGQKVEAGEVLLVLDQTRMEATNTLLRAKIDAAERQSVLLREELRSVEQLLAQGFSRRPRALALKRSLAELEGQIAQDEARLQANLDTMRRSSVRAPVSGSIVGLKVHTAGGVIKPGEDLMAIVPHKERLVIEARVDPNDIDVVHPGLETQVRLTPFSARLLPPVAGELQSISADRMQDETTGQDYYLARVALTDKEREKIGALPLTPGMPVEVVILTGTRTVLDYILGPLLKSFGRAFLEE